MTGDGTRNSNRPEPSPISPIGNSPNPIGLIPGAVDRTSEMPWDQNPPIGLPATNLTKSAGGTAANKTMTMITETNLVKFYSVQPASGLDRKYYISQEAAMSAYQKRMEEVNASAPTHSILSPDGDGGCIEEWVHHPAEYPDMEEHEPLSLVGSRPEGVPKWAWGNPATARPRR